MYHELIQRTFLLMEDGKSMSSSQHVETIEALVDSADKADGFGALQQALDAFLNNDASYSAVNSKRAQSVTQMLTRPDVKEMAFMTYALSHPLEGCTNALLHNASQQSDMQMQMEFMGSSFKDFPHIQKFFLDYVNGSFGTALVSSYVKLLDSGLQTMMYCLGGQLCKEETAMHFFKNA